MANASKTTLDKGINKRRVGNFIILDQTPIPVGLSNRRTLQKISMVTNSGLRRQ